MGGQCFAEGGARCDAAAVVAAEAYDVLGEVVEAETTLLVMPIWP
jgi:hypothetical protein